MEIDLFSLYMLICFPISDNVMVPQRTFLPDFVLHTCNMCIRMHNLREITLKVKKVYYYETYALKSGPGCLHKVVIYEGFQS